ncbi:hypothetical protein ASG04_08690 [Curtobacterium sp. Leaf183]|uniref:hypothetical protein n=1 Tax=Curtobacterium sp. Leaf183 TaxID=1736291 RepID=UPI0006FDCAD5|nr:hypothetical protein [Curtobacterium sp. Leaf183]KQS08969.1 hypothetical protein ASG04_08690 [Curtobacterium sp. Leaf183]
MDEPDEPDEPDDPDAPWLQRLRDGVVPPARWLFVTLGALTAAGALLLWAEALHLEWVADLWEHTQRIGAVVLVPPVLVVTGPVVALAAWWSGRRDRRVLARIRARGDDVALHLPVTTPSIREPDELSDPAPVLWTVDSDGLHGWSSHADRPVHDLPWQRIRRIDVATHTVRGQDQDFGIWIDLDRGHVVLAPRAALGRPFAANGAQWATLVRVLRALRSGAAGASPAVPGPTT